MSHGIPPPHFGPFGYQKKAVIIIIISTKFQEFWTNGEYSSQLQYHLRLFMKLRGVEWRLTFTSPMATTSHSISCFHLPIIFNTLHFYLWSLFYILVVVHFSATRNPQAPSSRPQWWRFQSHSQEHLNNSPLYSLHARFLHIHSPVQY